MKIMFNRKIITLFLNLFLVPCFFVIGFAGLMIKPIEQSTYQLDIKLLNSNTAQEQAYLIFLPLIQKQEVQGQEADAYYVSPLGNDSNPGTFLFPWKTINKAASSVVPGDMVYIRAGVYHEYVSINRSGIQAQPIRFFAYPGESPVMDGQNNLPTSEDGLLTVDGNWVEISGLEVRYSNYVGISLYGSHNTLSNVYVHHSWRNGVYLNGDYSTLQDSRIWRNSMHNESRTANGSSGVAVSRDELDGTTEYAIIRRNEVWENLGQGINVHHGNNIIIERNIVHDSFTANIYIHDITNVLCQQNFVYMDLNNIYMGDFGDKVGILMGQEWTDPTINVSDVKVINNILYGNHRNLFWYTGVIPGAGMTNVLFANNTFVNGSGANSNGNANIILDPGVNSNVRFINNIVQQDDALPPIYAVQNNGITYTYNLWSKNPIAAVNGTGNIVADPKLAKIGQPYSVNWFFLTSASPAINTAYILPEVTIDYFGFLRGSSIDKGAIEYLP